jgi:hypothetical protein
MTDPSQSVIAVDLIKPKIYSVRGCKVILDRDLAALYGIKPIRLREQVKRNPKRFPADFMMHLDDTETSALVSQNAIPSRQHLGGSNPYVFTEQGVAMLSSVLSSDRAIQVNIVIMRAFVKLREVVSTHRELATKLGDLERKIESHDAEIQSIFEAIRRLMGPDPSREKRSIGFGI